MPPAAGVSGTVSATGTEDAPNVLGDAPVPDLPSASPIATSARGHTWLAIVSLAILVAVAYLPVRDAGFVWDDDDYVTKNQTLSAPDGLWRIWFEPGATPQFYPLTFTSFRIEHGLWGNDPRGYHVVNVLLHFGAALLAWSVLRRLEVPGAWLAVAWFAVHPVHVESVAWVAERKNVLSAVFYLASLRVGLEALLPENQDGAPRSSGFARWVSMYPRATLWAALTLFAAALLAKTVTCSLPAALLLLVWWKRGELHARDLRFVAPFLALGMGLAAMTVWLERSHVGAVGPYWDLDLWQRTAIAGSAVWFSLSKLVVPASLSFVYPRWTVDPPSLWMSLAPFAVLAALLAAFLLRQRIGRGVFVFFALYVGTLFPALGFLNVYPMRYTFSADHYQYLASLAPIAFLAAAAARIAAAAAIPPAGLGLAVAILLAWLTHRRATTFQTAEGLWQDVIERHPEVAMAYVNLGMLRLQRGEPAQALPLFEKAAVLEPNEADILNDMALAYRDLGDLPEARARLERALELNPNSAQTLANLGNALAALGEIDAAGERFQRAVDLQPDYADALSNLAHVRYTQGDVASAESLLRRAVALEPGFVDAQRNLGIMLLMTRRPAEAIAPLQAALALEPGNEDVRRALEEARIAARPRPAENGSR